MRGLPSVVDYALRSESFDAASVATSPSDSRTPGVCDLVVDEPRRLEEHGPWSAPFTGATTDQELVLITHALAERHNGSGLHRGPGLPGFVAAISFEPTTPLERAVD